MSRPNVLVVEDDAVLRELLALHLADAGFDVVVAEDGEQALARATERTPDLAVLDVMLPGKSGIEVCVALRRDVGHGLGVLMVTARGDEADVVLGLDSGADDYVVKPVRPREVVARARAVLRRLKPPETSRTLRDGALVLDLEARRAHVGETELVLTPKEYDTLAFLLAVPERVVSRAELLQQVWDTTHAGYARNVDCHVMRVRRKLAAAGFDDGRLATVHGKGYRWSAGGRNETTTIRVPQDS